jgi:hypothetical protein
MRLILSEPDARHLRIGEHHMGNGYMVGRGNMPAPWLVRNRPALDASRA